MKTYLYIDESGIPTNPLDEIGNQKPRTTRVFCLGGIIVDEEQKKFLESEHKRLLEDYFKGIELEPNFKLHYNPLRMGHTPYALIGRERSQKLEREIFCILKKSNAKLLSFTLDLFRHYQYYHTHPVNPLAFGLIIIFERLVSYMHSENRNDVNVIYEQFNKGLRELVYKEHLFLQDTKFRTNLNLNKIIKFIENGDPVKEPILQFADFWAYIPFLKERSFLEVEDYSKQYYNFNARRNDGNVSIRY